MPAAPTPQIKDAPRQRSSHDYPRKSMQKVFGVPTRQSTNGHGRPRMNANLIGVAFIRVYSRPDMPCNCAHWQTTLNSLGYSRLYSPQPAVSSKTNTSSASRSTAASNGQFIHIRGARVHNLKNI